MAKFDCSITIKRPVEDVFAVMSDFSNGSKWASGSSEPAERTSDGPIGVGSTWHAVGKVVGRKIETDFEYTEFEVDRKIAYTITKPFPMTATVVFEPVADGTRVRPDHRGGAGRVLQARRATRGQDVAATVPERFRQPPGPDGSTRALIGRRVRRTRRLVPDSAARMTRDRESGTGVGIGMAV